MQQFSATPKNQRCREGVAEDCCILSILRDRPGARVPELGGDVLLRMRHTHKMATSTSGNAGRALRFAI